MKLTASKVKVQCIFTPQDFFDASNDIAWVYQAQINFAFTKEDGRLLIHNISKSMSEPILIYYSSL
jgi:hypothetical protein